MNDHTASTRLATWLTVCSDHDRLALGVVVLGVWACLSAGCRSGAESDLVARELRMQEDQLYAMEDYLTQYQQLLRKCRAENAALRCELDERDEDLPEPDARRRRPGDRQRPERPAPGRQQRVPPDRDMPDTAPPVDIELPEVPALEETTEHTDDSQKEVPLYRDEDMTIATADIENEGDQAIELAVVEADPEQHSLILESESAAQEASLQPRTTLSQFVLQGEVIANEEGGGPRFVVDIVPLSDDGDLAAFSGNVSLMILDIGDESQPQSLARWDFSPDEAQAAFDEADAAGVMRFCIELPEEVLADRPLQLWARLLPQAGEKLLTFSAIDIDQPGWFSSLTDEPPPLEADVELEQQVAIDQPPQQPSQSVAVHADSPHEAPRRRTVVVDVADGTWNVARPGETLAVNNGDLKSSGNWRPASVPLPLIDVRPRQSRSEVPHRTPRRDRMTHLLQQTAHSETAKSESPRRFEVPTWTPDRGGKSTVSQDTRPERTAVVRAWTPDR